MRQSQRRDKVPHLKEGCRVNAHIRVLPPTTNQQPQALACDGAPAPPHSASVFPVSHLRVPVFKRNAPGVHQTGVRLRFSEDENESAESEFVSAKSEIVSAERENQSAERVHDSAECAHGSSKHVHESSKSVHASSERVHR